MSRKAQNVLVIDIGGNNVKLLATGRKEPLRIPSGPTLTPAKMVAAIKEATADWAYDVISIGYPGVLLRGKIMCDPRNLGPGWMDFDFHKAFGRPIRIVNDAALQAIGSYQGGRMLFLGLGTGLGSAMIADNVLVPLELAHLPYRNGRTYEDYVGQRGIDRLGKKKWTRHVWRVVQMLHNALQTEYVVLGGGNTSKLKKLPPIARPGSNENAFIGGFRLWKSPVQTKHPNEIVLH